MQKKRLFWLTIVLILTSLCLPTLIFAETIILKTGERIEGKIIEETDKYIKIDFYGMALPYYFEDIESIDGKRVVLPSSKKEILYQESIPELGETDVFREIKDQLPFQDAAPLYNQKKLEFTFQEREEELNKVLFKAMQYFNSEQEQKAIPYFKKALEIDPNLLEVNFNLGAIYVNSGQYKEAIPYLQKALDIEPNHMSVNFILGVAYFNLGQHQEAIPYLQKALQLDPKATEVYYWLGYALYSVGQYSTARKNFQKAKELYQAQGSFQRVQEIEEILGQLPY